MAFYYRLKSLLGSDTSISAYKHYRLIEDWCADNLTQDRYQFDYSFTICIAGVDIPGGITLYYLEDIVEFNLRC